MSVPGYSRADTRVYKQLRHEMETTSHGGLFLTRDICDDPLRLLDLHNAYIEPEPFDGERFEWLKTNVLTAFIIQKSAYLELVESMDEVLQRTDVREHVDGGQHGSIAWVTNHISYADIAIMMAARTDVALRRGSEQPTARQVAVVSRLISLFRLDVLRTDGKPAYVADDGLLHMGGYLQTVPASALGSKLRSLTSGADVNEPVRTAYAALLNKGVDFLLAPSGTQDKPSSDGQHLVMDTVSRGTTTMLTEPNTVQGAERLLTVPMFIDCNPFVDGAFMGEPVSATHRLLEPRYLRDAGDVTDMMDGLARVGTIHKRPGTLPLAYKHPTLTRRVVELAEPESVYKS